MATRKQRDTGLVKCSEVLNSIIDLTRHHTLRHMGSVCIQSDGWTNNIVIFHDGRHEHLSAPTRDELIDKLHRVLVLKEGNLWK